MRKTINFIVDIIIVITIALIGVKCTCTANAYREALIPSYDTIYINPLDSSLKCHQIYINDGSNETYILHYLKNDSIIKRYYWKDEIKKD